jgi:PAS domain S-box-containing protein
MGDEANGVYALRRQQAAIADFGSFALHQTDRLKVMTEAARVCAESLGVRFCKVCQYRPAENDLLVIAGCGWQPGVVGRVVSRADKSSPQGRAFISGEPSICVDLRMDNTFNPPAFYAAHGIISTVDVIITGDDRPYGVLEIDSDTQQDFGRHDIDFLTAFANVLSETVATAARNASREALVEHLARSEERFRIVVDAAPNALVMFNVNGRIEMANDQAERTFGYPQAELLGQKLDMLVPERFHARHPALVPDSFREPLSRQPTGGQALLGMHKDGHEFQVEIGLNSIRINGDTMVLSSISDVSGRIQLEAQLRQAQKMEAVGRLTAGVAHDFNNLLQALMGGLELLLDHVKDRPQALEYGQIALRATLRGGELTHSLLAFSRQQKLTARPVPMCQVFDEVADLVAATFGPNIRLAIAPDIGDLAVMADAAQLQAAILNLAMNARDAMNGHGPLTISAHVADADASMPLTPGDYTVIAIEDAGTGMDDVTVAKACEPFFSTKGLGGSGLGLSMVQGFARQSGGDVRIVSAVGRGTRVEIWLPSAGPPEVARANAVAREASSGHILLVDDEADVLITIGAFLRSAGYLVTCVETGDKALARILTGGRFDAIVTDYAMPGLNGLSLLRQAREIDKTLPGLIITGYYDASLDDALEGASTLRKPFSRASLIERVDALLVGQRQISAKARHNRLGA